MSESIETLEASLRAAWSWDELAVYGDALLASGDPRGELIALDLAPRPDDPAWLARRTEVLARWLGAAAARDAGLVPYGFIHELRTSCHPLATLDGPAGAFVRRCTLAGDEAHCARGRAALGRAPRPWLGEIVEDHGFLEVSWTDVRNALQAVELCPTLRALDSDYAAMFALEPLLPLVVRCAAAGFVELVGPCVRLTDAGMRRARGIPPVPLGVPTPCNGREDSKWVIIVGEVHTLIRALGDTLQQAFAQLVLDEPIRRAILELFAFLARLPEAGEGREVRYPAAGAAALRAALVAIEEVRLLGDDQREIDGYQRLRQLADAFTDGPAEFFLCWGF